MSVLTQGTQIYFIDPEFNSAGEGIRVIECATAFSPGGAPADQIEDTCLEDQARSYRRGLATPGQASLTVNADPANESHVRLFELSQVEDGAQNEVLKFAVGWSDGIAPPTGIDSDGDFILPTTRTWFLFEGYIADFPFDFALNTVVTSAVSIQRSGVGAWIPKV